MLHKPERNQSKLMVFIIMVSGQLQIGHLFIKEFLKTVILLHKPENLNKKNKVFYYIGIGQLQIGHLLPTTN